MQNDPLIMAQIGRYNGSGSHRDVTLARSVIIEKEKDIMFTIKPHSVCIIVRTS